MSWGLDGIIVLISNGKPDLPEVEMRRIAIAIFCERWLLLHEQLFESVDSFGLGNFNNNCLRVTDDKAVEDENFSIALQLFKTKMMGDIPGLTMMKWTLSSHSIFEISTFCMGCND
jgi:hypothetical protein